jgi:cysteine dioxygenase
MQALVADLTRTFEAGKGARAAEMLAAYASGATDWSRYACFEPDRYTRNLVARNEHFELLILCWGQGHRSPIHDHQGQRCWMGVLEGKLVETQYRMPRGGAPRPLEKQGSQVFEPGGVAYITDDIALHDIGGLDGGSAVSLHLYAGPIAACRLYDPATGAVTTKVLEYDSVGGQARASTRPTR